MRLLTFICCCVFATAFGQKAPDLKKLKTNKERIRSWVEYCDELIVNESYVKLRVAGKRGLNLTSKTDYEYLSLFNFYIGVTFNYGVESDSATYYLEKSELFGRKAKNPKRILEALKQLQYVYANYGETEKQTRTIKAFQHVIDTTRNLKEKSEIYSIVGDYYIGVGQYESGLSYKLRGIKSLQKLLPKANATDSTNFGVQLIIVSELYVALKKYDLALEYLKESEVYVRDYKLATAHIHKDRVECYSFKNEPKNARKAYGDLLLLAKKEADIGCWGILIESDLILAKYYTDRNDFKTALSYTNHARDLAPKYADDFLKAQLAVSTGMIHLKQKDYASALKYFKAAEPTTSEDDPELNSELKGALAKTYAGLGQWKEAFRYQKEFDDIREKLTEEKSKKNVAEMEARYQNEKKQSEINQLSSKNTISQLKIDEANQQLMYSLLVIAAVLVIGFLFYIQSRNRKRHNAQLELLNEELKRVSANKTRFFSIINHDLRSPVANLIHFLQLQKESPDLLDEATKARLEHRTMESAENLLRSMEDMLLWSKGQMQQFKPSMVELNIGDVFQELQQYFATNDKVKIITETDSKVILITDLNYLLTIMRNLTANAIKALEKVENPTITWSVFQEANTTRLIITDNGPGATKSQFKALYDASEVVGIKTGLGLHLIRDLAQAINCKVEVDTEQELGTRIILTFSA